jgi:hypothetical protein
MRKLLFALVMMLTGAFAFGAGTPANAATAAGPVSGLSEVIKTDAAAQNVQYYYRRHRYGYRRGFCWRHPYHWRCRRGYGRPHYYRRHYYRRPWWY